MVVFTLALGGAGGSAIALTDADLSAKGRAGLEAFQAGETDRSVALLEEAMAEGDAVAAGVLGEVIMATAGDRASQGRACDLYERAADGGVVGSLQNLATCYFQAVGRPLDYSRSFQLYLLASEAGVIPAHCSVGNQYLHGLGVAQDKKAAVAYCRRGAEAGDANAQTDLGQMYLNGDGVERDLGQAYDWFVKAARQNQPNALFHVANFFLAGSVVEQNIATGNDLLGAAARHGNARAPFKLASYFVNRSIDNATGTAMRPDDAVAALFWTRFAAQVEPDIEKRLAVTEALNSTLLFAIDHVDETNAAIEKWNARTLLPFAPIEVSDAYRRSVEAWRRGDGPEPAPLNTP